jgi:hypothetical protein
MGTTRCDRCPARDRLTAAGAKLVVLPVRPAPIRSRAAAA